MSLSSTIVILVIVGLVLYVASRWMRSRSQTEIEQEEARAKVQVLVRTVNPRNTVRDALAADRSAQAALAAPEPDSAPNGLNLSRYRFRTTTLEAGPLDPEDFYDEIFIDLIDPETGQLWQNSMHVATPRGLERTMRAEQWDTVIGGELLIVLRYDLATILDGAATHLEEIYEAKVDVSSATGKLLPDDGRS